MRHVAPTSCTLFRNFTQALCLVTCIAPNAGCDADPADTHARRQLVGPGVSDAQALEVLEAAGASNDLEVADFYIHRPSDARRAETDPGSMLLPAECFYTIELIYELGVSECYCMRDGNILCIDFSWWDDAPHASLPMGTRAFGDSGEG